MINFSVAVTAVQKVLGEHSSFVGSKHSGRINWNRNWLFLKQLSELLIVSPIVLDISDVFHVDLFVGAILAAIARLFSLAVLVIVILPENAEFGDVLESLVHPATCATVIIAVTV